MVQLDTEGDYIFRINIFNIDIVISGLWPTGPATLGKLFGEDNMAINLGLTMFAAVSLRLGH